jgi:hypothetical protein
MKSPQGGNLGDPRGIDIESEMIMNEHPYRSRSSLEMNKGLMMSLLRGKMVYKGIYLQNNVSPIWNKTKDDKPSL